jgi:hypothetical protein
MRWRSHLAEVGQPDKGRPRLQIGRGLLFNPPSAKRDDVAAGLTNATWSLNAQQVVAKNSA